MLTDYMAVGQQELSTCYNWRMPSKFLPCLVSDCDKRGQLKGYCIRHADANLELPRCDFGPCGKAARHAGLCSSHYQERRNHGTMTMRPGPECTYPGCTGSVRKHVPFCAHHIQVNIKLKSTYGITLTDKIERAEVCGGRCQSCGDLVGVDALVVDHCHATGKVRGLLCQDCNKLLGFARDEPARLHAAAAYLEGAPSC